MDWSAQRLTLVRVIGRLKPGVTLEQAETEISALSLQANSQVSPPFLRMRAGMRVMATTLREKLWWATCGHFSSSYSERLVVFC